MKTYQKMIIDESTQQKLEQMFEDMIERTWNQGIRYNETFEEYVGKLFEEMLLEA